MKQKICGAVLLLLCICIIALAGQGVTVEERDITPVLLLGPLGLYLIFTKEDCMIHSEKTERTATIKDDL